MKAVKEGAEYIIVDVSETTGTPSQEDQNYFAESVFPFFEKTGLKALITVLPQGAISKMGAKRWQRTASSFAFSTYDVESTGDAEGLINDLRAGKAAKPTPG